MSLDQVRRAYADELGAVAQVHWPALLEAFVRVSPVGIFDCVGARDDRAEAELRAILVPDVLARLAAVSVASHHRVASCLLHGEGFCLQTGP